MGLKNYILLTKNKVSLIDAEDYAKITSHSWCASLHGYKTKRYYAQATIQQKRVFLHRWLLNAPKGLVVDHINGDTLDNRKDNLRLVTTSENLHNRHIPRQNRSGYRGIYPHKTGGWSAEITVNGRRFRKWFLWKKDALHQRVLWNNLYKNGQL